jgi:hypothetical protein
VGRLPPNLVYILSRYRTMSGPERRHTIPTAGAQGCKSPRAARHSFYIHCGAFQ